MTYLIIANVGDLCAERVRMAPCQRSAEVLVTCDPVAERGVFSWELDTEHSSSSLTLPDQQRSICAEALRGVFVRSQGGPEATQEWTSEDYMYVQAERRAALVGWLHNLPCPVVNRLTADLWFRPYRPYAEWQSLLRKSGLPTLRCRITNDFENAVEFARRCGPIAYTPLTSNTRYLVQTDDDWRELEKVLKIFPVCLKQTVSDPRASAWLVGDIVIWNTDIGLPCSYRLVFERGLRNLASLLNISTFEIAVGIGPAGLCCDGIDLYPRLENYERDGQSSVVGEIVSLIGAAA